MGSTRGWVWVTHSVPNCNVNLHRHFIEQLERAATLPKRLSRVPSAGAALRQAASGGRGGTRGGMRAGQRGGGCEQVWSAEEGGPPAEFTGDACGPPDDETMGPRVPALAQRLAVFGIRKVARGVWRWGCRPSPIGGRRPCRRPRDFNRETTIFQNAPYFGSKLIIAILYIFKKPLYFTLNPLLWIATINRDPK
jgi:hypothetical protein